MLSESLAIVVRSIHPVKQDEATPNLGVLKRALLHVLLPAERRLVQS